MTTYLIKNEADKTFHFRVTVKDHVCSIVEGQFFNWLSKYSQGCENNKAAKEHAEKLVKQKLEEGFKEAKFIETLENEVSVYDKAKWHYGGDFPEDLDDFQGYVHTGMFLGWLIDNDLISEEFKSDHAEEIEKFKNHMMTGSQIFERCCDGVLMLEDLCELGNRFALPYFDFETGQYLNDYETTLAIGLPSLYYVPDTWENYLKLKQILNKRLSIWKSKMI
ncbi:MAG: hypothetical protein ACO1OF_18700 [Adhaeribacter sp.]